MNGDDFWIEFLLYLNSTAWNAYALALLASCPTLTLWMSPGVILNQRLRNLVPPIGPVGCRILAGLSGAVEHHCSFAPCSGVPCTVAKTEEDEWSFNLVRQWRKWIFRSIMLLLFFFLIQTSPRSETHSKWRKSLDMDRLILFTPPKRAPLAGCNTKVNVLVAWRVVVGRGD